MNKFISYVVVFILGFAVCAWTINHFYGSPSGFSAQSAGAVSHITPREISGGHNNQVHAAAQKVSEYVVNIDTVGKPVRQFGGSDDFFGFPFGGQPEEVVPKGQGSGVIFTPDGYIVTNNHVVKDAAKLTVTLKDGRQFTAKLIGRDPRTDLAVIKIDTNNLPFARFADSNSAEVGDWVIAVGSPLGFESTVTVGVISATGRRLDGMVSERLIQTDASINPGNSGGALADMNGNVVGINSAIASTSGGSVGIGFAIPSNIAQRVANQLKEHGKVVHPWLGVTYAPVNVVRKALEERGMKNLPPNGALIREVIQGGPAADAGLQPFDVITRVNGKTITGESKPARNEAMLSDEVNKAKVEQKLTLDIWHSATGRSGRVGVVVGEMPAEIGDQQP